MIKKYIMPPEFLRQRPHIVLVGAGGTGSAMVTGLADMATSLPKLGGVGINVTVMDDDRVSKSNIGRQAFAPSDVGQYKADIIVSRVNQTYGLDWTSKVERLTDKTRFSDNNLIFIGCVDTRAARLAIQKQYLHASTHGTAWWLDCGNEMRYGQSILGVRKNGEDVLPCAADLFPELIDVFADATDDRPSCSLPEALAKQDLFTNRMIANSACCLLWQLFRYGETEVHGTFTNLESFTMHPVKVSPVNWERLGYKESIPTPKTSDSEVHEVKLFEPA